MLVTPSGGLIDGTFRMPTHEEVKEFCLMTGGGYGDVDQKEGKFYIGAYLHSLGEETMRNGALRDVASDHPASTAPRQVMKGAKHRWASSTHSRRMSRPDMLMQGRPPRGVFRSEVANSPTRERCADGACRYFGSMILKLRPTGKDEEPTLRIRVQAPQGARPPQEGVRVSIKSEEDMESPFHEWPSYNTCGPATVPGMGSDGTGSGGFPSTMSHLVGHVPMPAESREVGKCGADQSTMEDYPWHWKKVDVSPNEGEVSRAAEYKFQGIKTQGKAVTIQIPLFVTHVPGKSLADLMAWKSRVHDWALDHTLEVHFDGQKMNTFHLRKSLWMAGAMDESQDDMEEHHVQSSVEELAEWKLEGYFKEKTLDRDMDYLRAVDPGITNSMTVASGRLYWHSNWDQERAMFVAVPSKRNRYYAPTTRNKTLPQTKTPTPRDSFDSSEWWAKPAIESGMHETSPYLLRFLVEHIWNVRRPKLVLTITGGADEFQLAVGLKDEILRGLMDVAKSMQAWIITGGSASGIMRYVGEAHAKEGAQVPLIGIIPWGSVSGRQGLLATPSDSRIRPPTEQLPQDYEECVRAFEELTDKWHDSHREVERPSSRVTRLDHNHTHFILVKDGQSHRYGTEIPLRTAFEACVTSHTSYTREILRMLNDQKLGWQGMNVEKIRNKDVLQEGPQGSRAIPAVCVCIEGGSSSIATVASAARNRLPVVIVKKTGRAADLLADVGDIYDPGVERNTDRMNLVNRAFELLDSLDNVDHLGTPEMGEHDHEVAEAVLDALDAYGLKDPSTKTSEQAALLFQCRDAVCTGRCFVVDYDEDTQSISDLNGAILESILWGWGSDIHEAQRATLNGQPSGTRVSDPLMKFPDSKWSAKRHQGIKYSRELFLKKLIIIVQWDRPDLLRKFLEDIPPKSSSSEQVYRGMETVWQQALDAALEEAIISRQGRQTELVKVLLEHGADLDIFKVDQRRLCNQLVEVPEIKHVLEREQQELVASMRNSSRHRREPATSLSRERSSLEKLELTLEDKDVLAASRWTRLMGVRKRWQDARHLIAMMHRSKNKLIETSRKMRQFVDQEHGSKTTGNASTEQGVLNKDAQAMLRIASIKASFLRSSISDEGSNKVRRQNALGMLVKLARTLIKVDRLFADSLGPQFRYKLGMMDPQWDLMLWSVLVNRTELAVFFWERASQPVVSALTAIHLYRAIKGDVRPEMRDDIDSAVQDFENRAVNVQQEAMGEDIRLSLQYLECPLLMWGGWTGYDLAVDSNCREFVTKCCRQAHHERWYGDMMQMDVAAVARWHLPLSVCLMIYVAFFPMFWVTLAFSVGHHYTHISPEGVDATEAMLKENSCFPYPLSPWGLTRHETKTVLWVVTASLLPVLLVAPLCIQPINHMGWRVPPVSESLRPPGQLRNIPQGYPSEPFINPHLVTYYSYLVGRAVAKDLRSTGNMSCISYHWVSVRQILRFWLQRTWSMFLSHEETTEEVKERQLLRTQSFYKGKHQTLSKLGADIDSILEHVSDAVRKDFLECMSLDGGEPTISELEYYVGKKAARTREAKFIKWMQTLRKNPDAWDRMSASETAVLWSPSFRYLERLKCFMCAPATVFAMNSVTFASFVLVFTMLVIYPEYAEKPLDFVPWEEVYVIVAMTALLFQELIQIYEGTGFVNYLSEHWNWLDLAGQILFWIGFAMRMNCVFTSSCKEKNHFVLWNCAKSPPLIESCDVEQSEAGMCAQEQLFRGYKGFEYWQLTRQLYSLSCGCCWLRLLHIYSASESLGALVIAIFGMFKDIVVFVAIILICVTGFAVMLVGGRTATDCLPSEDPQAVHGFCLSYWWWLRTYFMGYGEIPLDELQDVVSLVVACVAMLIVHLILMNTAFVAMITSSYDAVMVQSKQTWMINLYNLTEDYIEGHTTIPVPFNLMYHIPRNLFRILSWLTLGKSVQDTAIRMHKRREAAAGLQVSEARYLKKRYRNPRFRNLEIIPTELLNEVDGREPPSDLNFASGQDGGDVVKFLVRQELQLKSHILSLRQGSQLLDRAKQRYLRRLEQQNQKEEQTEASLRVLSRQLEKIDSDVITLRQALIDKSGIDRTLSPGSRLAPPFPPRESAGAIGV